VKFWKVGELEVFRSSIKEYKFAEYRNLEEIN